MIAYRRTIARCLVLAAIVGYSPLTCRGGTYQDFKDALANDDADAVERVMRNGGVTVNSPIDWWYEQTPLHMAAREGAVNTVRWMIERCRVDNIDIAKLRKDKDGATPLHLAVFYGKHEVAEELMKADPRLAEVTDKQDYMALHRVIREYISEQVADDVQGNADKDWEKGCMAIAKQIEEVLEEYGPIQGAAPKHVPRQAEVDRDRLVECLLPDPDLDPDPDKLREFIPKQLREQVEQLEKAISQKTEELEAIRRDKDANKEAELTQSIAKLRERRDNAEKGILEEWKSRMEKVVEKVITARVASSKWLGHKGYAPIHLAAQKGTLGAALHILKRGEHMLDEYDTGECTLLHLAAQGKQSKIVQELLMLIKKVKAGKIEEMAKCPDDRGRTFLHYATACPRTAEKVIEALEALCGDSVLKALFLHKDSNGRAPLHQAAIEGHLAVVRRLVEQGAEVKAKDAFGLTPPDLSTNKEVTDYLLSKGAAFTPPLQRIVGRLKYLGRTLRDTRKFIKRILDWLEPDMKKCPAQCFGHPNPFSLLKAPCGLLKKIVDCLCCGCCDDEAENNDEGRTNPPGEHNAPALEGVVGEEGHAPTRGPAPSTPSPSDRGKSVSWSPRSDHSGVHTPLLSSSDQNAPSSSGTNRMA